MNRHFLFATTAFLAIGLAPFAMAADMPVPYKAPVPVAAPVYNWTGFYLGVNGGYAWGQQDPFNIITNRFDSLSTSLSGGVVGGTSGAQVQVSHVVLGVETDIDWANIRGSTVATPTVGVPAVR